MINKTPVLLLTGYLGSGKTTLLNRILTNKKGIRFAVVVNDIGEVNIDADLIQQGGIVDKADDSLVALQNGCICCTLKMDLVEQLHELLAQKRFDYIVIEASGICEPAPIAQTICSMPSLAPQYVQDGIAELDCIVTVVDALRMRDEFGNGSDLVKGNIDDEDIENLLIQQIEFCNMILLNKAADVTAEERNHIKQIIRALQPKAEIIECNYGDVDLDRIVNTGLFDFDEVAGSAAWIQAIESDEEEEEEHEHEHHHHHHDEDDDDVHEHHHHEDDDDDDDEHEHHHHEDDDDDDDEHEHHHHHHHDHDHEHPEGCTCGHCHHNEETGEAEEYGIGTFVYRQRRPFNLGMFDNFVAKHWPKNIIRAKGICYFADEYDTCYVFEQAGKQFQLRNAGQWYATMPADELADLMEREPSVMKDWDEHYGDRMEKLVFIGQHLDKEAITEMLDKCLE
ncbi:MAG: GTP-binding protein [Bacteroidales bacterium]|nr:GTP-binding protein [Candidatus Colicola faecequi]